MSWLKLRQRFHQAPTPTVTISKAPDGEGGGLGDGRTSLSDKRDLRDAIDKLAQATQKGFAEIHTAMVTKTDLAVVKEEILDEFKVIAENIHQDVAGANKDEVDLLTNQVPDHEERIVDLENKAGLPAGPRFQHVK